MKLTSTGLGIGTTRIAEKLNVNGNLRLGNDPTLNWAGNHLTLQCSTDSIGVVRVYGTSSHEPRFEIFSDAEVLKRLCFDLPVVLILLVI